MSSADGPDPHRVRASGRADHPIHRALEDLEAAYDAAWITEDPQRLSLLVSKISNGPQAISKALDQDNHQTPKTRP